MGVASLGFSKGPSITFRIDPESIDYNITVHTSVTQTVGGTVIQLLGTSISDFTVQGSIGEDHTRGRDTDGSHKGVSWKLAEQFFQKIQQIQQVSAQGASTPGSAIGSTSIQPVTFLYSPLSIRFQCYIKSITDSDGDGSAGVVHKVGRANYRYTLTLFPVQEGSTSLVKAGTSNGVLDKAKAAAIDAYIGRISQGIGWKFTAYNGGSTPSASWNSQFQQSNPTATPNTTLGSP
jgi:hypothetical protein